ncbi:hypothetical protein J4526_02435 [Desulfurococcaceae archaeon MEX13E-LK6-19]|nr:hypothetical protein J4526_02435 [Desulfurococcaceae archaeon MEX13E-LK6-19]
MDINEVVNYISQHWSMEIKRNPRIESIVTLRKIIKIYIDIHGTLIEYPARFYIGVKRDHIIIPGVYCSCKDYVIHVMSEKKSKACIHLFAEEAAKEKNLYRTIVIDINTLYKIINEIMLFDRSPTLRRILYKKPYRK